MENKAAHHLQIFLCLNSSCMSCHASAFSLLFTCLFVDGEMSIEQDNNETLFSFRMDCVLQVPLNAFFFEQPEL